MRRIDDALWKGLLENTFDDFLRFFFEGADELFDFERGFTYLDKELADLFPQPKGKHPKHVDKLVKVFTRAGDAQWVLVHVEVQGHKDERFAFRMFTYFYRILDKYGMPITAIAIFTDSVIGYQPSVYKQSFLGTEMKFRYNTYKVLEQSEKGLEHHENPFAIAIQTVQLAIKSKSLNDEELFELKFKLLRNLFKKKISKPKIDGLLLFIQLYVHFEKPEYMVKFEEVIDKINHNDKSMGIREFVIERARMEGEELGLVKGLEKGIQKGMTQMEYEKNIAFITSLIASTDFDNPRIAQLVGVSIELVNKVKKKLKK
ncbi:hypothetical protein CLV98_1223 [Dyadobacter jejuensis]|uniref:Transposase/invertase (TIGR01784 family) n=1 Tax=Dyadobacter jejuensis TaxID=1082580 RepID=A0A316ATR7_9BACT|nr:hypothetical protein [Dyadobacter jejuensis]PWJ53577.1 hypothetical protein CLV98_1223 [Dyadobacter jejuensis]